MSPWNQLHFVLPNQSHPEVVRTKRKISMFQLADTVGKTLINTFSRILIIHNDRCNSIVPHKHKTELAVFIGQMCVCCKYFILFFVV